MDSKKDDPALFMQKFLTHVCHMRILCFGHIDESSMIDFMTDLTEKIVTKG
jgi:hypothetical protein